MAKATATIIVLLLVFLNYAAATNSGCTSGSYKGCFYPKLAAEYYSRKMLLEFGRLGSATKAAKLPNDSERIFNETELRSVPSGPDPLHHNGHIPRKPIRSTTTDP